MTYDYFKKQVFCTLLWLLSHSCLIIGLLLMKALWSSLAGEHRGFNSFNVIPSFNVKDF